MKTLIIAGLLLLTVLNTYSQKWALLDKNRKLPILFTDSVTAEQLNKGFFPIESSCIDTFINKLEELQSRLEKITRSKLDNISYPLCSLTFDMNMTHLSNGDRYDVVLTSNTLPLQTKWRIIRDSETNKANAHRLEVFIKYLKKNMETDKYRFKKGDNKNEVYKTKND